jgi:hypothetical protein
MSRFAAIANDPKASASMKSTARRSRMIDCASPGLDLAQFHLSRCRGLVIEVPDELSHMRGAVADTVGYESGVTINQHV